MRRSALALLLAASLGTPAGAAPTSVTDLGDGSRAYARPDAGAFVAGVELAVQAGLARQSGAQNGLAALVAECVVRTPVNPGGVPLGDAVEAHGASLRYAVGVRDVRFYLEGTPAAVAVASPLVAAALAAPAFDARTLAAAREALGERIADGESDPRAVGRAMLRTAYYAGAAGQRTLGTPTALAAASAADAQAFYAAWYRRGAAVVVAAGLTGPETDAASRALAAALPAGATAPAVVRAKPFGKQPRRIVAQRDVAAPYVFVGFAAPALGDRDFAPALVVRSLLLGVLERPSAATLPEVFRSSGSTYGYDAVPAQLVVWMNGARIDPEVGLAALDAVVTAAAAKPLSAPVLARWKATARGQWILDAVTVDERAGAVANAVSHGLSPDANEAVASAIARVTAADVQRVAKAYFRHFDVAVVLPRGNGT